MCPEQDVGKPKNALLGMLGLLCAEQNVGNIKKWAFKNSGSPVRRTRRRKSKKNAISGILRLLGAEQDVGNLKKMHCQELWCSWAQNKTSEISKNALSGILGLLCAEQDLGNLKKRTFRNSGTLPKFCVVRRYEIQGVTLDIFF